MKNPEIPQFKQFELSDIRTKIAEFFSGEIYGRLEVKPEEQEMLGIEQYLKDNPDVLNRMGSFFVEHEDLKKRILQKEEQLTSRGMENNVENIKSRYPFLAQESF